MQAIPCFTGRGHRITHSVRLLLLCALLMLIAVPAAGAQEATQEGPAISGTLRTLGFGVGDEIASVRVDEFRRLYPDVQLDISEGALDEQQFLTAVASGSPPDLVYLDRALLSTYALRGALQPLDECIASQGIDISQYREPAVAQVTLNGQVYGIPEFFNIILLIANGDALAEAGLDASTLNTTDWTAIDNLNQQLTRFDGSLVTRIGFDPKLPEFFPLWARANGAMLLSEDGRTAMLNDPLAVEALEFANSLHEAAGGRQEFMAFRDTWDFFGAGNQMASNQLGAFPMEYWYINVLAGVSSDANLVVAPFTDRQGQPLTYATGSAWAIPVGSANPDAACAFMKTVTSVDAWVAAARARAELRAASGTINTGVPASGVPAFDGAVQASQTVQDYAFTIPANPAGAEFNQAWQDAVNRVINGEQGAQEALDQAQAEAQAALDEAWSRQG
jgi:multiple sugar transport system substrate-binding protein